MAGLCPGHPRLPLCQHRKPWMPGTGPGMTNGIFARGVVSADEKRKNRNTAVDNVMTPL
jgi:hypothetical protein